MLSILAAGSVFFPGLFLLSKQCLKSIPALRWSERDAVIVSARLVSSVQAVMATSAGYIIASSCEDIIEDQHWLTCTYIMFAVPYFVYDIYAMFMCYWYKLQVKGHEDVSATPKHMTSALTSYLRREFLMVLHHVVMVTVCFPVSVFWRQGKGDYFQGIMFMAELSTPSVCLGKILIQLCTLLSSLLLSENVQPFWSFLAASPRCGAVRAPSVGAKVPPVGDRSAVEQIISSGFLPLSRNTLRTPPRTPLRPLTHDKQQPVTRA
ncbi:Protein FAM57B [Takifugu flavidus]|uniref:Protein FAM57B n=1 Tax=Takifugu flavidus TaxID=433684 RepID=A0A5C6PNB3_9TELE|nr:Protein FAM57B [Takifugu flavidus]